jgi:hypothetical protein
VDNYLRSAFELLEAKDSGQGVEKCKLFHGNSRRAERAAQQPDVFEAYSFIRHHYGVSEWEVHHHELSIP